MKLALITALLVTALATTVSAKNYVVAGTQDSVCTVSVYNVIYEVEKTILQSDKLSLEKIGQKLDGADQTLLLMSKRAATEMGKKLYTVDIKVREIGHNKEIICEIMNIKSRLEN